MRLICFVPSLTETLIECGYDVVGRTRFCIHPQEKVKQIEVVGGTKDAKWEKIQTLNPDLVIFDQEENTKEMADSCPFPWIATHVQSLEDLVRDLKMLAEKLTPVRKTATSLLDLATQLQALLSKKKNPRLKPPTFIDIKRSFREAALSEIRPWELQTVPKEFLYLIWKKPWMSVATNTFIGSVLKFLELKNAIPSQDKKYPEVELSNYNPSQTLILFSSEPFPFAKYEKELQQLPFAGLLVDGECFSWFGIRTIRYLISIS